MEGRAEATRRDGEKRHFSDTTAHVDRELRTWPLAVVAVLWLLMIGVFGVLSSVDYDRISFASYQRIRIGMTKDQTENVLGGSPRWEVKPKETPFIDPDDIGDTNRFPDEWWGREGVVQVWYNNGVVWHKNFCEHRCEVVPLTHWDLFKHCLAGRLPNY